ncbi:MAG: response regulator [Candidatus Pacebacteria bacterium]|nr:response regulator [Candidatus Paceibacterota bacterium]
MTNKPTPAQTKKKIILVVEDDTNVQSIYRDLLVKEGYDVTITSTVDQACDALGTEKIDLVLLDIMLPGGKNGFDFLEIAHKSDLIKSTPIIVLSNLDKDGNVSQDMGIVEWLVKANISAQGVIEKINKILK